MQTVERPQSRREALTERRELPQTRQEVSKDRPSITQGRLSITGDMSENSKSGFAVKPLKQGSRTEQKRSEVKYLLSKDEYRAFSAAAWGYLEEDRFAYSYLSSLYLDTHDNKFLRRSLEKPSFREKLRVRSYIQNPTPADSCFVELKKKLHGLSYKRRVAMTLDEAFLFFNIGKPPNTSLGQLSMRERGDAKQILKEVHWLNESNGVLGPSFLVQYKRVALKEYGTETLRITFDEEICWKKSTEWNMRNTDSHPLLKSGAVVMEIKALAGMPLWLVNILTELEIYPRSFSKVGNSYKTWLACEGGSIR